jgi:DNA helicase-2/ATP-dependent DNA helicase PcrA
VGGRAGAAGGWSGGEWRGDRAQGERGVGGGAYGAGGDARGTGERGGYARRDDWRPPGTPRVEPLHAAQSVGGFSVGQNVRHAKFGEGVILKLEGTGADARARINFGAAGTKELLLGMAKLSAA